MKWITGILLIVITAGIAFWLFRPQVPQEVSLPQVASEISHEGLPPSQVSSESPVEFEEKPVLSAFSRKNLFYEVYRTPSHIFFCGVRSGTESNCDLFVSSLASVEKDLTGDIDHVLQNYASHEADLIYTGVALDYGSFDKKILPSPNGDNLLLVLEDSLILINTSSLEQKTIFRVEEGNALGVYTGFPSFVPYVKWTGNDEIRFSIFRKYTPEPYPNELEPTPLEVKTIQVNQL